MKKKRKPSDCEHCGDRLDADEAENPRVHPQDGTIMCDDCWHNEFMDSCDRCQETVETTELTASPKHIIGIWREAPGLGSDLDPGYYRVKGWPFFADGMIEGYFYPDKLERIADLDDAGKRAAEQEQCMSGPLCLACQKQVKRLARRAK